MISSASWGVPIQSTTDRCDYIGRTVVMRPLDSVQQLLNVNNDDVGVCWRALYDTKAFDECRVVTLPHTSLLVNGRCRHYRELVIEKRLKLLLTSLAYHHQTNYYVSRSIAGLSRLLLNFIESPSPWWDSWCGHNTHTVDLHCSILPSALQSTENPPRSRIQLRFWPVKGLYRWLLLSSSGSGYLATSLSTRARSSASTTRLCLCSYLCCFCANWHGAQAG